MQKSEPQNRTQTAAPFKAPLKRDVSLIVGKRGLLQRLKAALSLGEELCS